MWTARVQSGTAATKPVLKSWLSVPVVVGTIVTTVGIALMIAAIPGRALLAIGLGLVPLAFVLPALGWLDRVEPEPWASRVHALLWGATVAGSISAVVNTAVSYRFGDAWATIASAPLVEEATKGLCIYWAVRRKEVDGVMDGIVYAGWVGLGFAVVEDFSYFAQPTELGDLLGVFFGRAIATPFAHPLFSSWMGLAIGLAVARRQSIALNALWGYGLAVACHATWNSSIIYMTETGDTTILLAAMVWFVLLFAAAALTVALIRRHEQRRFVELAPDLARRYGLSPNQVAVFADWRRLLTTRRSLPRSQRANFDQVHAALARLALYHRRSGPPEPDVEEVLAGQLQHAVAAQTESGILPT